MSLRPLKRGRTQVFECRARSMRARHSSEYTTVIPRGIPRYSRAAACHGRRNELECRANSTRCGPADIPDRGLSGQTPTYETDRICRSCNDCLVVLVIESDNDTNYRGIEIQNHPAAGEILGCSSALSDVVALRASPQSRTRRRHVPEGFFYSPVTSPIVSQPRVYGPQRWI